MHSSNIVIFRERGEVMKKNGFAACTRGGGKAMKQFWRGTHRTVSPDETLNKLQYLASFMGITRVANITGLDDIGIPVAAAYRPNSRNISVSQGKGMNLAAAKVSALMESIEGFHAERIMHPLRLAAYEDISSDEDRVVDVDRLPSVINSRFHPQQPILWLSARNLYDDESVWLPFECIHTDYTLPSLSGSGCFQATSNGLSGGNHVLEAISHAVCELVERDATALYWARNAEARAQRRIDLSTVDDLDCREVLNRYESAGVRVAAWDITSDVGIPAFLCLISSRAHASDPNVLVADGMGCHPGKGVALFRALAEAAQSRLTTIAGVRDDLSRSSYVGHRACRQSRLLETLIDCESSNIDFREIRDVVRTTFEEDVAWELECLDAAGFRQILVVELTQSRFDIPVVRVVIPGLEGVCFQPDYVGGRRARAVAGVGR
jgi:ribosomal protein S12 methylthiotransferase accessory factor